MDSTELMELFKQTLPILIILISLSAILIATSDKKKKK